MAMLNVALNKGTPKILLKSVFQSFDRDNNGCLDRKEFLRLLTGLGIEEGSAIQKNFLTLADKNDDGVVSFEEFMKLMDSDFGKIINDNATFKLFTECAELFESMDGDQNGSIDQQEFYDVLKDTMSNDQMEDYWNAIDTDKSGTITFDEFWDHNKNSSAL
eukprot:145893_1